MAQVREAEVLIGGRRAATYVAEAVAHMAQGAERVVLKAMGRRISSAVDVSQLIMRTTPHVRIASVLIGDVEKAVENGRRMRLSTIEIVIEREGRPRPRRQSATQRPERRVPINAT